jgi:WD40 repeat protein
MDVYENQILASCSYDDTIRIWIDDPQDDWDCTAILRGHTSTVWSIAFSPDGNYIASGSDDRTVRIWKRMQQHKWECVHVLEGHHDRTIFSVAWGEGKAGSLGWIVSASSDGQIVVYQVDVSSLWLSRLLRS